MLINLMLGIKMRKESWMVTLFLVRVNGRLVILFMEINNSGEGASIGGNGDEISHVKVKNVFGKSKSDIL